MHLRAIICTFILLTQPLAAWSGVMVMPSDSDAKAVAEHCGEMPGHAEESSGSDCDIGCDQCVAATAIASMALPVLSGFADCLADSFVLQVLPPGQLDSPYRPPSLS